MGTLDLSELEPAPEKVKLPDGHLYDMASPAALAPLPAQRLMSRYRRAQELAGKADASDDDAEEMVTLLVDVAQIVVPAAPRDALEAVPFTGLMRLARHFSRASAVSEAATEEASTLQS